MNDSVRPPGIEANRPYYPAFDGIRAVAIVAVFVNHYSVMTYGRLGVSLFFVLSGFLITGVLLRSRGQAGAWKTFYMRRTLRIFPLYWGFWLVLICLTGALHVVWNRGNLLYLPYAGNLIWTFFGGRFGAPPQMVHVGLGSAAQGPMHHVLYVGHFWTLAVEEQFYLVWPLLVLLPRRAETVLRLCVGTIVVVFCAKIAVALLSAGFPDRVVRLTFLRCDEFAFGGLLASLVWLRRSAVLLLWSKWIVGFAAAMVVMACVLNSQIGSLLSKERWDFLVNLPLADLLAGGLILVGIRKTGWLARGLAWRPLVKLGQISYGFYVFHDVGHPLIREYVVWQFAHNSETMKDAMTAVLGFGIALGCATLSFRYFETPFLRLKKRWPERAQDVEGSREVVAVAG